MPIRVAIVLVGDGQGRLLFGKRGEDGRYSPPAGHLNEGEDPEQGARRELYEETGLTPQHITFVKQQKQIDADGNEVEIFAYTAQCPDSLPHNRNDPDHEFEKIEWVDCRAGIPKNIYNNLNGPKGLENVIRQIYDLKKGEGVWLEAGFMDLRKGVAQRLWPYNPKQEDPKFRNDLDAYTIAGEAYLRNRVSHQGMSLTGKARSLHKLHGMTGVRRNPASGEREFLLHRGIGEEEWPLVTEGKTYGNTTASSWTPKRKVAVSFAAIHHPDTETYNPKVVSAWIPESKIKVYSPQVGIGHDDGSNSSMDFDRRSEHEVIVAPGAYDLAKPEELAKGEEEPLEKMALIHNDPKNPKIVYRIQNSKGEGPYSSPNKRVADAAESNIWTSPEIGVQPSPDDDFSPTEPYCDLVYGFESPEHARNWFGDENLAQMAHHGYSLRSIKASHVYRSKSGKQVCFVPHSLAFVPRIGKVPRKDVVKSDQGPKGFVFEELSKASSKFSETPQKDKSLLFVHNLTEDNLKHAHELGGLAAPSIAIKHKDHPFTGFGEVTLIAHPNTFDPAHTPTFAADAYSPRHPRPNYEIHRENLKKLQTELLPHAKMLDRTSYLHNSLEDDIEKNGVQRPLTEHSFVPVMKAAFLASKGIKIEPVLKEASMRWPDEMKTKAMRKFFQDNGHTGNGKPEEGFSDEYHKAMTKAYGEAVKEMYGRIKSKTAKEAMKEYWLRKVDDNGLLHGGYVYNFMDDAPKYNEKEPDVSKTTAKIEKHFTPQMQKEFDKWALAKIRPVQSTPYIPKRSDYDGRIRRIPYTIHNVLKEMTRKVRSGEDFNYGLGNARAKGTPQLGSLMHTKAVQGRLVPSEEFERVKKENDQRFFDIANKIKREPGGSEFGKLDSIVDALGESFRPGHDLKTELKACGLENVDDETINELKAFGKTLLDMPSEYFEGKPQRIVNLNEFRAAVVPHNVKPDTIKILKQHGINRIEKYRKGGKDEHEERNRAVNRAATKNDLMLSEDDLFEFELLSKSEMGLDELGLDEFKFDELEKTEDLAKMAIPAIQPGKALGLNWDGSHTEHDYSHVLPPNSNVNLVVSHSNTHKLNSYRVAAYLIPGREKGGRPNWLNEVGCLTGCVKNGALNVNFARLNKPYQRKGYGKAMYEALVAHSYHNLGAKTVEGNEHSTMAHQVHESLARKHGTSYQAKPNRNVVVEKPGPFDDAYGPYSYHIKNELQKSETEASKLLTHPNPVERSLAIKLDSTTPEDIGTAILDPDDLVWRTAFNHKDSGHALDVLASTTRDASGNVLLDRHDALLKDPRCLPRHLDAMIDSVKRDLYLPLSLQAQRIYELRGHPLAQQEVLSKSEDWGQDCIVNGTAHKALASAAGEEVPEHLGNLAQAYQKHFKGTKPTVYHHDVYELGNVEPKVMYQVPVEGAQEPQQLMVKPYREKGHLLSGWSEGSTQALYHAASMGHLCQRSFTQGYGKSPHQVPVTVIHVTKGKSVLQVPQKQLLEANPGIKEDARKIALMDFLSDNPDRHSGHLLVTPENQLMAIGHSGAFEYEPGELDLQKYAGYGPGVIASWHPADYEKTLKWWPEVEEPVRNAFKKRLELVTDGDTKEFLEKEFNRRAEWLDSRAKEALDRHFTEGETVPDENAEDMSWIDQYLPKGHSDQIRKALGGMSQVLKQPKEQIVDHSLLNSSLGVNQKHVDYFHQNLNAPEQVTKPYPEGLDGSEAKRVFKHADQKFIVKSPVWIRQVKNEKTGETDPVPLQPAWNEMGSQALYHAAGIGHLHQSSHVAMVGQDPALVIHMEPDVHTYGDLGVEGHSEQSRIGKMVDSPGHVSDLRKMAAMEYITGNFDRHPGNLMIKKDGQPFGIDHSLAFNLDHWHAMGNYEKARDHLSEVEDLLKPGNPNFPDDWGDSLTRHLGGDFTQEEKDWWNNTKKNVFEAFVHHTKSIKSREYRKRMLASFNERFNEFNDKMNGKEAGHKLTRHGYAPFDFSDKESLPNGYASTVPERPIRKALPATNFLGDKSESPKGYRYHSLLNSHPKEVQPYVDDFKKNFIGSPGSAYVNIDGEFQKGIEPKAVYGEGDHRYLVKQFGNEYGPGGFNEMFHQSLYHAAGIGRLHQKAHIAQVPVPGKKFPQPALVIHMEPKSRTYGDYLNDDECHEIPGIHEATNQESYRRIGLMDYLTSNQDRHTGNILIRENGEPMAIDHGYAFDLHHDAAIYPNESIDAKDSWENHVAMDRRPFKIGGTDFHGPDWKQTWKWWLDNADNVQKEARKYINKLPLNSRARFQESFLARHHFLTKKAEEHLINDKDWINKMKQQSENTSIPVKNVVR